MKGFSSRVVFEQSPCTWFYVLHGKGDAGAHQIPSAAALGARLALLSAAVAVAASSTAAAIQESGGGFGVGLVVVGVSVVCGGGGGGGA